MWLKCSLCNKNCFYLTLGYFLRTPGNSNLFSISLEGSSIGSRLYYIKMTLKEVLLIFTAICKHSQGVKKIIFTTCHSGKLKLVFTSPDVIATSPKSFLTSRIDFTVLLLFKLLKKHHLPVGLVKNRIYWPNSKIH